MHKNGKELLPLTSDIVFKRVFSIKGNEDLLKSLLESILKFKIKNITIQNTELPPNLYDNKTSILDINAQLDDDVICDIEMQVKNRQNIDSRSTHYMTTLHSDQLKKGKNYLEQKKVIVINILDFNYYKRNSYHNVARMKFEDISSEELIDLGYTNEDKYATNELEMHFIELPKFRKKKPDLANKLEQWLCLIDGKEETIDMIKNKEIKKALNIIEKMSLDEKEWQLYRSRQLALYNYNTSMANAKNEGLKERPQNWFKRTALKNGEKKIKIEIAKKMKAKNIDISSISDITGLSIEEINIL